MSTWGRMAEAHLGFHNSLHRQKSADVLRTKMDHFLFWLNLAGKFRVMREVVAEQEESLTSGGTKILKGWGPLLLGSSL